MDTLINDIINFITLLDYASSFINIEIIEFKAMQLFLINPWYIYIYIKPKKSSTILEWANTYIVKILLLRNVSGSEVCCIVIFHKVLETGSNRTFW